jgi:AcrR family transcriptional regulator
VLDRAMAVFWEKGYAGASFRDLTEAMGISPPSLVAAFGDKHGLFLAAVERYAQTVGSKPMAAFGVGASLADGLCAFFSAVIANARGEGTPTGCLLLCALADAAGGDAQARERLAGAITASDAKIAAWFAAAGFDQEEAADRARLVAATMHSIALRARADATRTELERTAHAAIGMLARGAR